MRLFKKGRRGKMSKKRRKKKKWSQKNLEAVCLYKTTEKTQNKNENEKKKKTITWLS